jgi:aconitate hydratase
MFGMPLKGEIDYSADIDVDLADVQPSVAGPKRPQDRINLPELGKTFRALLEKPVSDGGYGKQKVDLRKKHLVELNGSAPRTGDMASSDTKEDQGINPGDELNKIEMVANRPTPDPGKEIEAESSDVFAHGQSRIGHGSILIAAITSCTNTSNPSVMIAAGLLAKKAVERGLRVDPAVKTSLAPGSRIVSDYLDKTGLQKYLDQLGFNLVGYGCTTCIGNSGPLHPKIERAIHEFDLVAASVLSGNRNFEARVHQNIKANFLMSPPLVVAFALAGRVNIDLSREPLGKDKNGKETFLRDLWPNLNEIKKTMQSALRPETFRKLYHNFADQNPKWNEIPSSTGDIYEWDERGAITFTSRRFSTILDGAGAHRGDSWRTRPWHLWRFGYDRSHFARGSNQGHIARRAISRFARHRARRFQQLRQPARQRFGDDPWDLRECADQEFDAAGDGRGRD